MSRQTQALIKLSALQHNLQRVRELIDSSTQILAMVKANAYGHGLVEAARTLHAADALGVAEIAGALRLRQAGITQPIVVMGGFFSEDELPLFIEHDLTAVIHHPSQISVLQSASLSQPLSIWMKLDTGMHRLGFLATEFAAAYASLQQLRMIKKPFVIMTHLADADSASSDFTQQQLHCFADMTDHYSEPKSICHSAGILAYTKHQQAWVRPGIMLYGASPFSHQSAADLQLQPVMTLQSQLMAVKTVKRGAKIGYGCTYECPADMPVGVVAIGYGDGYPRHAPNGTPVLINGQRCPLVGRVSMDMITVDLRPCPTASVGDIVTLWGDDLPIETIAKAADTISYELLTKITPRVTKVFIQDAPANCPN